MPWVIAHRGCCQEHPENSLAALELAADSDFDGVEFDVRLSQDGVPVVIHDENLSRVAGVHRVVSECTTEELAGIDLGEGEGVPQLSQVLGALAGRIPLMVELKGSDPRLLDALVPLCNGIPNLSLLAFDPAVLQRAERLASHIPRVWNQEHPQMGVFPILSVFLPNLNVDFTSKARKAGKKIWTFTVKTEADCLRAWDLRVDACFSDNPQATRNFFEGLAAERPNPE